MYKYSYKLDREQDIIQNINDRNGDQDLQLEEYGCQTLG